MTKLLDKPFKAFTWYALIILACSAPVYYLVVDYIWIDELDEHNLIIRTRIEREINKLSVNETELTGALDIWNQVEPGTNISPVLFEEVQPDSTYTIIRLNPYSDPPEVDRFRGLSAYFIIKDKPYHITIETNVEETDETFLAISFITLLFFGALVAGFIILNRRIATKAWQPFQNTLQGLKSFDLTSGKTISLEKSDIKEFEELNHVVQKLIDKNVSVYNQQKRFIENASHELQTPLAVLRSKLDLLVQNKDITEEQAQILSAIDLPLSRVTRINKNLLLLAKIENSQFAEIETLDIRAVLLESIELLTDYAEDKNIHVDLQKGASLTISANRFLLETLLQNMLTNAIRHTLDGGSVKIMLDGRTLCIKNSGTSPLKKETLFQRFAVSSSGTINSGLGLAIVKEIANLYRWQIGYTFQDNSHSFSIEF